MGATRSGYNNNAGIPAASHVEIELRDGDALYSTLLVVDPVRTSGWLDLHARLY